MARLHRIIHGMSSEAPPLLIAHGLFGAARNWGAIGKRLARERQVVAVDMRNHGESPWEAEHSYAAMAGDLAEVIEELGGRADVLGHSMGGKAAMMLALTAPQLVDRLIVADVAPVAYDRSQIGYVEAMRATELSNVSRRADAEARLAVHVEDPALRAFFLQSIELGEAGPRWKLNLDALGAEMPKIMGFEAPADAAFEGPTVFITGATSDYVTEQHWPLIARLFPAATRVEIPGAGHWVHADAPNAFIEAVETFLRR